jgi:hypothetical protein
VSHLRSNSPRISNLEGTDIEELAPAASEKCRQVMTLPIFNATIHTVNVLTATLDQTASLMTTHAEPINDWDQVRAGQCFNLTGSTGPTASDNSEAESERCPVVWDLQEEEESTGSEDENKRTAHEYGWDVACKNGTHQGHTV